MKFNFFTIFVLILSNTVLHAMDKLPLRSESEPVLTMATLKRLQDLARQKMTLLDDENKSDKHKSVRRKSPRQIKDKRGNVETTDDVSLNSSSSPDIKKLFHKAVVLKAAAINANA